MEFARKGKFSLKTVDSLRSDYIKNNHDLEIVKWAKTSDGRDYCYTIAFIKEGKLESVDSRLLESIDDMEELDNVKGLFELAQKMNETDIIYYK